MPRRSREEGNVDPCDDDMYYNTNCLECNEYITTETHMQCRGQCVRNKTCKRRVLKTNKNNGYCYQHRDQYVPNNMLIPVVNEIINSFNTDLSIVKNGMETKWHIPPGGIEIELPIVRTNEIIVQWGDDTEWVPHVTYTPSEVIRKQIPNSLNKPIVFSVYILGAFTEWTGTIDSLNLIEIVSWGTGQNIGTNCSRKFRSHRYLTSIGTPPDLGNVTNMYSMFSFATSFNQPLLRWDVSKVTNMRSMFEGATSFNQPLAWDTSKVTNMYSMFDGATSFNQPLAWDVSKVTDMRSMFEGATRFNQPLVWDVSKVTDMCAMFAEATCFNQPLVWDTSQVTNMSSMFADARSMNQPLVLNTSKVTNRYEMFRGTFISDSNLIDRFYVDTLN